MCITWITITLFKSTAGRARVGLSALWAKKESKPIRTQNSLLSSGVVPISASTIKSQMTPPSTSTAGVHPVGLLGRLFLLLALAPVLLQSGGITTSASTTRLRTCSFGSIAGMAVGPLVSINLLIPIESILILNNVRCVQIHRPFRHPPRCGHLDQPAPDQGLLGE